MSDDPIHVIGGGLAGCEASFQAARAGAPVILHEMRPILGTAAHRTGLLAELVCSNSFRSDDARNNAVGLLHAEMRALDSLILACADANQTPAGAALAVDRDAFSQAVTQAIEGHHLITIERGEVALPPPSWTSVIIATGPLTSPALATAITNLTGEEALSFFDAIAPVIHIESIDRCVAWKQSRWAKTGPAGDDAAYLNCPMTRDQYEGFIDALLAAPKTEFKDWENVPYFEGCLPIEVMAQRGRDTPRYGPMKPVGLADPRNPERRPWAVVQLRQDNALGTLWNMVGFQTKMKHAAQVEIFRTIPGLERAVFARLGGMHRNTFLNSPALLDPSLRLKADPRLSFAGQITGVEGYVESAALGLIAGRLAAARRSGEPLAAPPPTTAVGALIAHVTGGHLAAGKSSFQPMNINYGLLPPLAGAARGRDRKRAMSARALADMHAWISGGDISASSSIAAGFASPVNAHSERRTSGA